MSGAQPKVDWVREHPSPIIRKLLLFVANAPQMLWSASWLCVTDVSEKAEERRAFACVNHILHFPLSLELVSNLDIREAELNSLWNELKVLPEIATRADIPFALDLLEQFFVYLRKQDDDEVRLANVFEVLLNAESALIFLDALLDPTQENSAEEKEEICTDIATEAAEVTHRLEHLLLTCCTLTS